MYRRAIFFTGLAHTLQVSIKESSPLYLDLCSLFARFALDVCDACCDADGTAGIVVSCSVDSGNNTVARLFSRFLLLLCFLFFVSFSFSSSKGDLASMWSRKAAASDEEGDEDDVEKKKEEEEEKSNEDLEMQPMGESK